MVYSRDFYVAYGADTVLILYGDTLAATSGIISSVLSDGVTITGDGTSGNELKVDTATVISTIQGLVDSLSNYVTTNTSQTITGAKTFTSDLDINGKIALNNGSNSVFIGDLAGVNDGINDNRNVGIGYNALNSVNSGKYNTANGGFALYSTTTGTGNIANGYLSLGLNETGNYNIASGQQSLYSNVSGDKNIAFGYFSLLMLSSGSNNQAYGYEAGRYYGSGSSALSTANGSLFLGTNTRASADGNSNEIVIGTDAIGNGSNSITLGASTNTKVVLNGVGSTGGTNSALYITSGGELTTNSSDERLKTNINPLDAELSTLMNLNPVTYNYINNLGKTTFGFIAQELEEYYPDLVFINPISKYKGIHYHLFAPIITKAIQEQQAIIETQEQKITDLQNTIQSLITRIENLENK
jgi:hypothetical protein